MRTSSNFVLNLVHSLYREGNAYALALREQRRFEIASLHLMNPRQSGPMVAYDGLIFYRLAGNDIIDRYLGEQHLIVPQRDVLHVRLHAGDRHPAPLVGDIPLLAAMEALARGVQVGIYSVNDARNAEDLDAVPHGDQPRTQAQNVPLSAAASIPSAPSLPAMPAADAASTKHQQATVQKDIEAMRARTTCIKRVNGAAKATTCF